MLCPRCGADNDKVIDSRSSDGGAVIRRRRECLECGMRFTTYEQIRSSDRLMVVKKDGSRVIFNRANVMSGIVAACGKRPVSEDAKEAVCEGVEAELHRDFDREVPSVEIGRRVAARLREIDQIAYIRYASEYYAFRDLDDLVDEVTQLQSRTQPGPNQSSLFEEK
ncbi:MAG: transcriptional regulator NrdR [Planctomycetota bacterium]|nr:transcriptional regulator NrdR [Planctomycetota bacterium]